jgi:hypothetical protein
VRGLSHGRRALALPEKCAKLTVRRMHSSAGGAGP